MSALLHVDNLHLSFKTRQLTTHVLRGVEFSLFPNEILAIVGESGSGKSVMVKSLLGLLPGNSGCLDSGRVMYENCDLLKLSEKKKRAYRGKKFGFVFQDPQSSLNPTMKIGRQIEEGLTHLPRKERYETTLKLLSDVGISAPELRYHQYPHQFSGGMRQRVTIAVALAPSPNILIMDEPTTALDATIQAQILHLIQVLKAKRHMSILFITHDLSLVAGFCDRILVMYAGQIVESGPVERVLKTPAHPYTQALVRSIPRLDGQTKLMPIAGSPPDLRHEMKGCPFALRCPHASFKCSQSPPLVPLSSDHQTNCWLYDSSH